MFFSKHFFKQKNVFNISVQMLMSILQSSTFKYPFSHLFVMARVQQPCMVKNQKNSGSCLAQGHGVRVGSSLATHQ